MPPSFLLDRIGEEKARCTTIVEYQPNSKFPTHTHIGGEEFLVLKGTFKDQFGAFPAGTYVRNPIGSQHAPWVDDDGCTIMVKLLQMADTGEDSNKPLHINLEQAKTESGKPTEYGTLADLYHNQQTGELVQMCWLDSDKIFPVDDLCKGGEELFVMQGSLTLGVATYPEWGWLRFPAETTPSEERVQLKAGSQGAQVFRKTGHLTDKALSMEKIQINEDETFKMT